MCEYTCLAGWHVNAAPEWKQLLFSACQKYRSIFRTCGGYEKPLCGQHEGLSQFVLTCTIELGSCQLCCCCCCCCCCCPPVPPTVGTLTESLSRQDCPAEVAADLLADGHTTSKAAIKACKCSSERRSATTGLLRAISIGNVTNDNRVMPVSHWDKTG